MGKEVGRYVCFECNSIYKSGKKGASQEELIPLKDECEKDMHSPLFIKRLHSSPNLSPPTDGVWSVVVALRPLLLHETPTSHKLVQLSPLN